MNKFLIIEVNSYNTKTYLYEDKIKEINSLKIEFKSNYLLNKRIVESDLDKLLNLITELQKYNCPIYVFGTGVFGYLDDLSRGNFLKSFKDATNIDFTILTQDMENDLVVNGAISNIDYDGKIAIMIGSSETTDLYIVENKKIIEELNNNYGSSDICDKFSDINDDTATTPYQVMVEDTLSMTKIPDNKADILILAGHDYLSFYDTLKYPLNLNRFYYDSHQPYYLDYQTMLMYDEDFFYHQSLLELQNANNENHFIWNGLMRGMHICITANCQAVNAQYIIPTRLSVIYGIIEKIKMIKE